MAHRNSKPAPDDAPKGERIARRLARAGLCSRREAERWIAAGRVSVDGRTLDGPAVTVTAASRILVDGRPLPAAEPAALWRYHKPAGLVTTNRDPQGRPTVFDRLPAELPRVMTVGRLDLTTEGLLLLTNDGALARHLELPATGWSRRYRVRVHGTVDPAALEALAGGVTVSGVRYGPIAARLDRRQGANAWLTLVLREGKNREVRRVCEHLGLTVNRLIRVGYGPFELGDLAPGAVARVPARVLRDQLGGALPELDFGPGAATPPARGGKRSPARAKGPAKGKGAAKVRGKVAPRGKPPRGDGGKPARRGTLRIETEGAGKAGDRTGPAGHGRGGARRKPGHAHRRRPA